MDAPNIPSHILQIKICGRVFIKNRKEMRGRVSQAQRYSLEFITFPLSLHYFWKK